MILIQRLMLLAFRDSLAIKTKPMAGARLTINKILNADMMHYKGNFNQCNTM